MSGRCWRSKRLETPLRLFTSEETGTLGGYCTSRCTWSSSPSICTSVACASEQTSAKMPRRRSIACASNTRRRYFATKTQCTCSLKTQCLPCRMLLSLLINQPYHRSVKRWQAFKFELRPNGAQRRQMRCFAGSCRFVYNKGLALQNARFDAGEKKLSYGELCKLLTQWRSNVETSWLKDAPIHPLQQALKDLERAYANFFAQRSDLPRFKKKGQHERFRYPDSKEIKLDPMNSRLFLPKLGWVRHRNSRTVLGKIKNLTVSLSCGKWFVSVQTEREVEQPLPRGGARRDYL